MSVHEAFERLQHHLERLVIGQEILVHRMLVALLVDGHLLVEGAGQPY